MLQTNAFFHKTLTRRETQENSKLKKDNNQNDQNDPRLPDISRLEALSTSESSAKSPLQEAVKSLASNLKVEISEDLIYKIGRVDNFNKKLKQHLKLLKTAEEKLSHHLTDLSKKISDETDFLNDLDGKDWEYFREFQADSEGINIMQQGPSNVFINLIYLDL